MTSARVERPAPMATTRSWGYLSEADSPFVRLGETEESAIAELAQQAAKASAKADALERKITADAEKIIAKFIAE